MAPKVSVRLARCSYETNAPKTVSVDRASRTVCRRTGVDVLGSAANKPASHRAGGGGHLSFAAADGSNIRPLPAMEMVWDAPGDSLHLFAIRILRNGGDSGRCDNSAR